MSSFFKILVLIVLLWILLMAISTNVSAEASPRISSAACSDSNIVTVVVIWESPSGEHGNPENFHGSAWLKTLDGLNFSYAASWNYFDFSGRPPNTYYWYALVTLPEKRNWYATGNMFTNSGIPYSMSNLPKVDGCDVVYLPYLVK
jgi:hypothetical protein